MLVRWIVAILIGSVVAAIVGILAWALSPVAPDLSGIIFAAAALPFGVMLGWIIAVAPKSMPSSSQSSDNAETTWMNTALAGTATDIVVVAGLGLAAISITRTELPTQLVLLGILLVAFASTATRYAFAQTRAVRA
jgi:hypothetical protein